MTEQSHKYWASTTMSTMFLFVAVAILVWAPTHEDFAVWCMIGAFFA